MKNRLIIMRGLPASGKSTKSKELVENGAIRINKDLLRTMLHFDKFSTENERSTYNASRALATDFLKRGMTVVIDDTNLKGRTFNGWVELAKELRVEHEVIEMNTPVDECIRRDAGREKKVGEQVIRDMAQTLHEKG